MMRSGTQLYRAFDFQALWDEVVRPWFEFHSLNPLSNRPVAVLLPTMAYAQFLKAQLVKDGVNIMGIHFLTPGQCWTLLCDRLGLESRVASRPDLHLLLSVAATGYPDVPSARSIAADPSALMRSVDQLAAAGWDGKDLDIKTLWPIIAKFRELLKEAGLVVAQDIDRQLAQQASRHDPVFRAVLLIGFDGRHWPVWSLLNAAVVAGESASICLCEPRLTAASIDQNWLSSWEEVCGEAESVPPSSAPRPLTDLTEAMESGTHSAATPVEILVGSDVKEEAQAILAQALSFLADTSCDRLGIVFPGPGPLARETACLLSVHQIPHHDSLGHNDAPALSDLAWREWLSLQEQPDVQRFLSFVRLCPEAADRLGAAPDDIETRLRNAYDELMVDDLRVLAAYLKNPLPDVLESLPESATFSEFVAATRASITTWPSLGGSERLNLILEKAACFNPSWTRSLPRRSFVRWLTDTTANIHRVREAAGNHPFARVQIVAYDKAEWQAWSHLILAGLNRNSWPPDYKPQPFLDPGLIDELNGKALKRGSQGEGQLVVKPGKGMIISPAERSAHVRRQFYNIIESAGSAVCFTASRTDPDDTGRKWNPSDLLVRVHAAVFGSGLSDDRMDELQATTSRWLKESTILHPPSSRHEDDSIRRTRQAYEIRRDPAHPFGSYEFGLNSAPAKPVFVSCTDWERAIKSPELVWMKCFLGTEDTSWSLEEVPWSKVIGLWAHRWMSSAIGGTKQANQALHPLPSPQDAAKRLAAAMQATLAHAERSFTQAGRPLPDWWRFVHRQACSAAGRLAQSVTALAGQGWRTSATEWRLPDNLQLALPGGGQLNIRGRIDLLLASESGDKRWIIDYKTGSPVKLTPASVASDRGLQILLYGMALQAAGHNPVLLSVASPDEDISEPVDVNELLESERIVQALATLSQMQERGIFGMRGSIRAEHGFSPTYPLATLKINEDILDEKWVLSFGQPPDGKAQEMPSRKQKSTRKKRS